MSADYWKGVLTGAFFGMVLGQIAVLLRSLVLEWLGKRRWNG